ncbi:MAG: tRNA epoxyqueuosine(34) reductase QueG [Planctomycetota bacterium]
MTPAEKALRIKTIAGRLGLDLIGITTAAAPDRATHYRRWLARGYAGPLRYLTRNVRVRSDPSRLLPGARTVICAAVAYKRADGFRPAGREDRHAPEAEPLGTVAQYARGRDYHTVLRRTLGELVAQARMELREPLEARVCVDTAPLLERELAARAGLGWIGRNTCLINDRLGSYLLLGEIITTMELPAEEAVPERCGRCERCLQACPSGALVAPYELDAARCIACLTIEQRGPIPVELHPAIGDRVFGCDVCQQVCPYNARAPLGRHPEIMADTLPASVNLLRSAYLPSGAYRRMVADTAARRATRPMWQRNAVIALRNVLPEADLAPSLADALESPDPGVRDAARAAVARRGAQPSPQGIMGRGMPRRS